MSGSTGILVRGDGLRSDYGGNRGAVMDDPLCRVTIQCAHTSRAVDLSIPRHAGLGLLIPDIVALVVGTDPPQTAWRLDRITGDRCDESRSLHDNGVHDGDVIVLAPAQSAAPGPVPGEACVTLSAAGLDPPPPTGSAVGWTVAGIAAAAVLVLSGVNGASQPATAILAAVVAVGALRIGMRTGHVWTMLLCIVFAGAAAFLATPGRPGAGHLLLTSAVCASVSVMLLRVSEHGTRLFTAIAAGATAIAAVTATALALPMDLTTHGATLAVVALGGLAVSGRLALLIDGIRPGRPLSGLHADRARDRLAGLVSGFAATATVAAISVAASAALEQHTWPATAVLVAVIAVVLSLRMRSYADPRCRHAVGWSGLICATAGFVLLAISVPVHAGWSAVTAFGAAAWYRGRGAPGNPLLARVGDVVESLASAAVIPLACWAGGVFDLVRSTSLP
ncbi:type VII secretion integral membrane protein EccD [Mycolicibacterium neoaurum]|uniref:Type VII secretion integral membrane protein EccD n=1 Tax=Mycolicibacterium neoaurum TaxID=1795 RepID=A0AAV2WRY9_MYCNE|nr:type VII secretion integral membrane protein EccD [Mycolicibacterium neoaurum]CDQ46780.1 type VII secretion integral membrane protein EccD [Mycolicibacterium neoaurum]